MRRTVLGTVAVVRRALARRDGQAAFVAVLVGYPLIYLLALGHLSLGGEGTSVLVVADPLERMVRARSPFSYEPVARVVVEPLVVLVSPLNLLLTLLLGALVALNAAVSVVSWRAPRACGVNGRAGVLAGVPALLGGATCCGPALFFVVGVQATGALVSAFGFLVPLAVLLLVGSLLLMGRGVELERGASHAPSR